MERPATCVHLSDERNSAMRVFIACASAFVLAFTLPPVRAAQGAAPGAPPSGQAAPPQGAMPPQGGRGGGGRQAAGGPDPARVIPGGGVFAQGWTGKVDAAEAANGQVLN